jgi:hypothetical protein
VPLQNFAFSGWLVYLQFREGFPLPLFSAQGALPSFLRVFFVVIVYYSGFFSFFPEWGLVCPGGYADLAQGCLWEYCVPLSSPVVCFFPSDLGAGVWWWCGSPPGFSV